MSQPGIRVLLVEDVATEAELEVRELRRAGLPVRHRVVDSEQALLDALRDFAPDVILSDFSMPHFDGMAALAVVRQHAPGVPFIFVSGTIGEEYAIRALKSGAMDYVLKTNLLRLPAAVERAIEVAAERRAQRRTQAELDTVRERLTSIFNTLPDMLWSVDGRDDRILHVSPAAKDLFGRAAEEFLHDQDLWLEVVHADDRAMVQAAWDGLRNGAPFDLQYRSLWPDGTVRWIHDRAHRVHSADGRLERIDGIARDVTDQVRQQERIRHLALYDQLTGLPNRTLFHERLAQAILEPRHNQPCLALVLLDLERFKAINDTLGRQVGDGVLAAVARWLLQLAGDADRVARLGADQFALLFYAVADAEEARRRLEDSARTFFSAPIDVLGNEVRLAAKAGIALFPNDGRVPASLFRNAEAALKRAKETGERCVFYTREINAWVAERVELENRLRKAVENGELLFHYQPKYDLASRRIVGLEALMRWNGPGGTPVPPVKFVPILEQTGLILEAGRQALAAASALFRRWRALGLNPPRIAVNVSALQLRRQSFVADVRSALGDIGQDGGGVDLEITESLLMTDVQRSIQKLAELRGMGLKVALDDFGTGYSSLAYLSMLPLDALKIDRSFVRGMMEKRVDSSIITTIISLAQALRLKVVAEGVETEAQAQLLHELGCDQAQGFLLSRPRPEHEIELVLRTG
jgi:diguanylate cyclase (GGDEF)-like protein/PAS domain S-box-containing protein